MNLPKIALALGIGAVLATFVGYSLFAIYEPPRTYETSRCYESFSCEDPLINCSQKYEMRSAEWQVCYDVAYSDPKYENCLDSREKCEEDFGKTTERYNHSRNSFFILLVVGIIAIVIGLFISSLEGIGSGLIGGGVLIILWSLFYTQNYWITLSKYFKIASLGLVLFLIIYLGYKKIEKETKKGFFRK